MTAKNWEMKVEDLEESQVRLEVTVPQEVVESTKKQVVNELQQKVEEPGFRKGRVPAGIINNKYGLQVKQQLAEKLMPRALMEVYREKQLQPIADPQVEDFKFDDGFYLKAVVEVLPEVDLKSEDYLGIELVSSDWTVGEEEVEQHLEKIRTQSSVLKPVEITRPVREGDFVRADLQGYDNIGNPVEGTAQQDATLEVGGEASGIMAEIGEGLIDANVGEKCRVSAHFPEEFLDSNLAGKEVFFDVEIKEISQKETPDLEDEEFLKERGFESFEDLREKVEENLLEVAESNRNQELTNQIYEQLLENVQCEIPEKLQRREQDQMIDDFGQKLESQGQSLESFLEKNDKTREELVEEAAPEAERRIKLTIIFQAIIEAEEIELTDEEFEQYLEEWLAQVNIGMSLEKFKEHFKDEELMSNLRKRKLDEKVLDYLIEQAEIKEKEPETGETQDNQKKETE